MGEGDSSVSMLHVGCCVKSPGGALYTLFIFGEDSLKACFVEVPRSDLGRCANFSIGWNVNSSDDHRC